MEAPRGQDPQQLLFAHVLEIIPESRWEIRGPDWVLTVGSRGRRRHEKNRSERTEDRHVRVCGGDISG